MYKIQCCYPSQMIHENNAVNCAVLKGVKCKISNQSICSNKIYIIGDEKKY